MKYQHADDLQDLMYDIIQMLNMGHIDMDRVKCVRSQGSNSRGVIARVHTLSKAMQIGMGIPAYYVIEFLERYERLSEQDKIETIIHELLHIPKAFGGGFRHHDYVESRRVRKLYKQYTKIKKQSQFQLWGNF